ncbi:DedA family protein [Pseudoroseomonas wenyumeiae]|uniref:DedA family protein n=1 Tax=Teichococcus wenyumeiae TaxID=2478470 RepID=A0A3A9JA95_9PROT|nr:DedA family protein [Pseudoroseomonas wenyumeiae]RKK03362.1 DedA family protein [Pseudoroseomonas wenyumeiae]RMI27302.1 DedA family protein [Pseudoroseomonas wenyumeiae]
MIEWVTGVVESAGLPGVFALMFLENLFPPIPSELIMPLAGFVAAEGGMSLVLAIICGTAGSVVGNGVWYEVARRIGSTRIRRLVGRYGRWLAVSTEDLDKAEDKLRRHGPVALFFGRLLPAVRTLISIPAGLAGIPRAVFYLWTLVGSALWVTVLTVAGYLLRDQYKKVEGAIEPLSYVVLAGLIGAYLWHVVRARRRA